MKSRLAIVLAAGLLAACQSQPLEPIPGSLTYGGQPRTQLTKSPVGSIVPYNFVDSWGNWVEETYIIQPDRSLKLVRRTTFDNWPPGR
ncbi:hypothetical protein [Rhizobium sp. BK251]|uniref:hypothetical protein n=1 Tax=Rhizobium sp. BK251 TaxID=2512125 RepID=UPI0010448899|nr:hypothetical protein [Rhizobium sp. BK251]TCL75563.1 hypothetical protein EV286_101103 [Rhizobium sp. BK251]